MHGLPIALAFWSKPNNSTPASTSLTFSAVNTPESGATTLWNLPKVFSASPLVRSSRISMCLCQSARARLLRARHKRMAENPTSSQLDLTRNLPCAKHRNPINRCGVARVFPASRSRRLSPAKLYNPIATVFPPPLICVLFNRLGNAYFYSSRQRPESRCGPEPRRASSCL
jgi:hypothetical protein